MILSLEYVGKGSFGVFKPMLGILDVCQEKFLDRPNLELGKRKNKCRKMKSKLK